VLETAYKR